MDARPWSPTCRARRAARRHRRARRASSLVASTSASRRRRTRGSAGWHADYPDPDGFYLGLLELGLPLYRDDETDAVLARARGFARPRRAPAPVPRVRAHSGSASVRRSCRSPTRASSCCAAPTCRASGSTRWAPSTSSRSWSTTLRAEPERRVADRERQRGARAVAVHVGGLHLEVVPVVRERRAVPVVGEDEAVETRLVRVVLAGLGPVDAWGTCRACGRRAGRPRRAAAARSARRRRSGSAPGRARPACATTAAGRGSASCRRRCSRSARGP